MSDRMSSSKHRCFYLLFGSMKMATHKPTVLKTNQMTLPKITALFLHCSYLLNLNRFQFQQVH